MKPPKPGKTIRELVQEFFRNHPNIDLPHGPVVDWVTEQWRLQGSEAPPRDPWRTIRRLHQEGWLIKVRKGVYRHDPEAAGKVELDDFTPEQKQAILERDQYRCVICGKGLADGVELHVDHIRPRHFEGVQTSRTDRLFALSATFGRRSTSRPRQGSECSYDC